MWIMSCLQHVCLHSVQEIVHIAWKNNKCTAQKVKSKAVSEKYRYMQNLPAGVYQYNNKQ